MCKYYYDTSLKETDNIIFHSIAIIKLEETTLLLLPVDCDTGKFSCRLQGNDRQATS